MLILFLHGLHSIPGAVKPTYLKDHGHTVLNPALPDEDFAAALAIAQAEFDKHHPDVIVGSSRGGALAMNLKAAKHPSYCFVLPGRSTANQRPSVPIAPYSIVVRMM